MSPHRFKRVGELHGLELQFGVEEEQLLFPVAVFSEVRHLESRWSGP